MSEQKTLHVITVSFVINHFFGEQFAFMSKTNRNEYFVACSPSEELKILSNALQFEAVPILVTRTINPIADLKAIVKLYAYIKKNKIDNIVGHTPKGGMVAMIAGYLAGLKNRVYFRHGIVYETSSGIKRLLLKYIDKLSGMLAKQVVCVSNDVKRISEMDSLNSPKKNVVLGMGTCNGIDVNSKFNPERYCSEDVDSLRRKLGIEEGDFVVGYVGRLVRDKGINELIAAWKMLKQIKDKKLLLVGPIEERDPISEESKRLIFSDPSIICTGFVLDSAIYFKLMDIFILPTYREGFPTVSLEASSMRLPVLTTKATGCRESIIEHKTGMFIENSSESIASHIMLYFRDLEMRLEHGENGRKFVIENFDQIKLWNEIIHKLNY
ncbi:glycosyltransferase family 4 protein [Sphingobacterium sp. UBA6645]|uniref:glycosyltransferase family 4 protein n=1 Tax=Sphingobacterium sp. UBA6645 TaxID=1947511 RepID=UPI0025EDF714|nr:glycosyltransferase family 4 protein [Sphingobacterium sp. UBA6645]